MTFGVASFFPAEFGLARGVDAQRPTGNWYAPGPYVQSEILRADHPVVFGYTGKTLPVRWADGPILQAGVNPEFAAFVGSTPDRTSVIARFQGGDAGVLSGLMRGADQIRNRPMVVDAPAGKGRILMFANNPIYRWQTFGEHGHGLQRVAVPQRLSRATPRDTPDDRRSSSRTRRRRARGLSLTASNHEQPVVRRMQELDAVLHQDGVVFDRDSELLAAPLGDRACRRRTRTRTCAAGAA